MKINHTAAEGDAGKDPALTVPLPRALLTAASSRLAATAAGSALAGSSVSLAFFLSRKPTASSLGRHHAKFRA
jgi:hypothetical protein